MDLDTIAAEPLRRLRRIAILPHNLFYLPLRHRRALLSAGTRSQLLIGIGDTMCRLLKKQTYCGSWTIPPKLQDLAKFGLSAQPYHHLDGWILSRMEALPVCTGILARAVADLIKGVQTRDGWILAKRHGIWDGRQEDCAGLRLAGALEAMASAGLDYKASSPMHG